LSDSGFIHTGLPLGPMIPTGPMAPCIPFKRRNTYSSCWSRTLHPTHWCFHNSSHSGTYH